jgi:hypothetical protein
MRSSRHIMAMLGAAAALSVAAPRSKGFDSIANPQPYENKAKRAKVKLGKSVRRQQINARCAARREGLAGWNAAHPNNLTWAQMQHPQMRARFEGDTP